MDFYRSRRSNLFRSAKSDEVDGYLITHPVSLTYLTGHRTAVAAVVTARGTTVLATTEYPASGDDVTDIISHVVARGTPLDAVIADAVTGCGCKTVAVEAAHMPVGLFETVAAARPKITFKPLADRVEALRMVKDPSEVEAVREAVRVAERAFIMFRAMMRESETELDLCRLMDQYVRHAGGTAISPASKVCLGEGGADPNHQATDRALSDVSKCLVTWGTAVKYSCLLTRSFRSPYSPQLLRKTKYERTGHKLDKVTAVVQHAHKVACETIRGGVELTTVSAAVRQVFVAAGYEEYADPLFGHGVGLEAIEGPRLYVGRSGTLSAGMVLSICPAIRIPDWGGVAHGTCVFVTRDGCQPLGNDDFTGDI